MPSALMGNRESMMAMLFERGIGISVGMPVTCFGFSVSAFLLAFILISKDLTIACFSSSLKPSTSPFISPHHVFCVTVSLSQ